MISRAMIIAVGLGCWLNCGCVHPKVQVSVVNHAVAPFEQFVAKNFDWSTVQRVVLMPLANQTSFPRANHEMQTNLATELQRAGRFEIVVASQEDSGARAHDVFSNGQFNEMDVLRIARQYQADAVIFGNVTQYQPYSRPRIGLSLLIVSPTEGIAIASISGMWDSRETSTSIQAQAYFKQTQNWPRSLFGADRVFESPDVFQRFVCQQIAVSLYPTPSAMSGPPAGLMPAAAVAPIDGNMPSDFDLPPMPPPAVDLPQ